MLLHKTDVAITTAADGTATVYLGSRIRGKLISLRYYPGTIVTGADLTITLETSGTPVLTAANVGTSNISYYPRAPGNQVADGVAITDSFECVPIVEERIQVAVAQGGATKTGSIEATWLEH